MKQLFYSSMLITLLSPWAAVSVLADMQDKELASLRLLSPACQNESSPIYLSAHCAKLREHLKKALADCEAKRDGVLVMDEARNAYVCAKAKPNPSKILLYPIPR